MSENTYNPDFSSHPGEHLAELLEDRDMTAFELAAYAQIPIETVDAILNGYQTIGRHVASQLEITLGVSAGFWIELGRLYLECEVRRLEDIIANMAAREVDVAQRLAEAFEAWADDDEDPK